MKSRKQLLSFFIEVDDITLRDAFIHGLVSIGSIQNVIRLHYRDAARFSGLNHIFAPVLIAWSRQYVEPSLAQP